MADNIEQWLEALDLSKYVDVFIENEVACVDLPEITESDLKEMRLPIGPRRRILKAIAELIASSHSQPDSSEFENMERPSIRPAAERRQLTVMFCDLVGSTELSRRLDPEDLREILRRYQDAVVGSVIRYEGYVAKFLGDGVLAYFGWPQAHEDQVERAVRTGLDVVEAVAGLKLANNIALQTRIGIATGQVVVGDLVGEAAVESFAVAGETPNLAARLQGIAAPNQVIFGDTTRLLTGEVFELKNLGVHELKGFEDSVNVWHVLGTSDNDGHKESSYDGRTPPLVGRQEELGLLRRAWEASTEGHGQVVLIQGDAGIGKSRLVEALREYVSEENYIGSAIRCSSYYVNSALYPVIEHLKRALDWKPEDGAPEKLRKLESSLKVKSQPLEEVVRLYADLLSLPLPEDGYAPLGLSAKQQRERTLDALAGWFLEEAVRTPVLQVWEDLQWADPTTLELLALYIDQSPTVSMMNVLVYRPNFRPPWPMRSHMTPIVLNRLERPQIEMLTANLTDNKTLPAEVIQHIVERTDGVPLYIEEMTKMLMSTDLLQENRDHYMLTGPLSAVSIPDTLQASLMARLDQLRSAKEVAQTGAVLGREFAYEMLRAISSQNEKTLQAGLTRLVGAELLYQRGRPPRAHYIFKHALIQDAAYSSLLKSSRQNLHRQVAERLETHFPEVVNTQPELVAHHYTEGNLQGQAVPYWQRAGQVAQARSAHDEAIAHLDQGLRALTNLPETPERDGQELALCIELGKSLAATKGWATPDTESVYGRAWEICQQTRDTSLPLAALWGLSQVYAVRADLSKHREVGEQFLSLAKQRSDTIPFVVAYWLTGANLSHTGELTASLTHLEQACALYDPQHHDTYVELFGVDIGVFALSYITHVLWGLGYPEQAIRRSHEALVLAQEVQHPFSIVLAQAYTAMLRQFRRELQSASKHVEITSAVCQEQGFAYYLAWSTIIQGWVQTESGPRDAGLTLMQDGLTILQATGVGLRIPYYLTLLAGAEGKAGEATKGLHLLTQALGHLEKSQERWVESKLYRLQGELMLSDSPDNYVAAESCFQKALDVARRQKAKSFELRAATSLARLWQSQGKRQEAYDLIAPVYQWFSEGFDTTDLKEAKFLLDEIEH